MRQSKLDRIDKRILKGLQESGRISNVELAGRAGISAPPCLRRVRSLEERGLIKSYHAKVDTVALGYSVAVFALVKLSCQAEKNLQEFETFVNSLPMVRECHMIAGDMDFLLKVVAQSWENYQDFLTKELTSAPYVSSVKSSLTLRASFEKPGVPIED